MIRKIEDPFAKIHKLLRDEQLSTALNLLLDEKFNKIKAEFRSDKNHAWYIVGDIRYRQRKFDESKNAFKRYLQSRPDDVQAFVAIGNCYDEMKKEKFAERYFRRTLGPSDRNADVTKHDAITFNLANELFDQRRMEEAEKLYKSLECSSLTIWRKEKNSALIEKYIK